MFWPSRREVHANRGIFNFRPLKSVPGAKNNFPQNYDVVVVEIPTNSRTTRHLCITGRKVNFSCLREIYDRYEYVHSMNNMKARRQHAEPYTGIINETSQNRIELQKQELVKLDLSWLVGCLPRAHTIYQLRTCTYQVLVHTCVVLGIMVSHMCITAL